jgi:hypothetical protein
MAATKKSAKRSATKKRPQAKRKASRKKSTRKVTSKGRPKKTGAARAGSLQRQARKGLKAARGGLDNVLQAGGKTWKTLKTTTAEVVEGVRDTLAGEPKSTPKRPGLR